MAARPLGQRRRTLAVERTETARSAVPAAHRPQRRARQIKVGIWEITREQKSTPRNFRHSNRLECLKLEIDLVDRAMARLETITQSAKNFALITRAGSVVIFLPRRHP